MSILNSVNEHIKNQGWVWLFGWIFILVLIVGYAIYPPELQEFPKHLSPNLPTLLWWFADILIFTTGVTVIVVGTQLFIDNQKTHKDSK